MSFKRPKATYLALPAAFVPEGGKWMLERWAEHQQWWHGLPFGWMTLTILAFWVGVVVQDLMNEKSALRHNWREWKKVFDVLTVHAGHIQNGMERVDIMCLLKFRRDIKNALLVVRVIVPLSFNEPDIKVIHQERLDIAGNGEKRLRLGNIAITRPGYEFARHSVWGEAIGGKDIALGQHTIYASKNIIEISIGSQTYRIYAHVLDVSRKEQSHIYLLTQDQLPEFKN